MNMMQNKPEAHLSELFGNYKAEWLRERIFELFTRPSYFPDLETQRPCILEGARGTGKTTVLRSLSYEGKFAFSKCDPSAIGDWAYYGVYYRVDTNRVTAFQGNELSDQQWRRLFAHYINLLLCGQILRFVDWHRQNVPGLGQLSEEDCRKISISLGLPEDSPGSKLVENLNFAKIKFEAYLNNFDDASAIKLSMQGAPIEELMSAIGGLPQYTGKVFFFLIDEYENLLDYQQVVVNTLIKHTGKNFSFKIGVRELGLRRRITLNANEQLVSPADYIRIPISENLTGARFEEFAEAICNQRLNKLDANQSSVSKIQDLFPGLSEDEEANILGVGDRIKEILRYTRAENVRLASKRMAPLEFFFASEWAIARKVELEDIIQQSEERPDEWRTRYNNYKHATLFAIRSGRTGIRKYYAGWDTFIKLSGNNIRYLLELVDRTLAQHVLEANQILSPVDINTQTRAAEYVGRKNVTELEGLSIHGAQLTKLVLGLGRVFQVMAQDVGAHSPEVNQFGLSDQGPVSDDISNLLKAAIMHLALVRSTSNKLKEDSDVKDYSYSLHPIYTPFFVYSYRKKRKMSLSSEQLLGLVHTPKISIRETLKQQNRYIEHPIPEQLRLFEGFYA